MSEKYRSRLVGCPSNVGHPCAPLNGKRPVGTVVELDDPDPTIVNAGFGGRDGGGGCNDVGNAGGMGRVGNTTNCWTSGGFGRSAVVRLIDGPLGIEESSSSESVISVSGESGAENGSRDGGVDMVYEPSPLRSNKSKCWLSRSDDGECRADGNGDGDDCPLVGLKVPM